MSSDVADEVCASCGVAAIDDVKLKDCDAGCDLVKYCSDVCQRNNREQHDGECKKRLAEIRERDLFEQPDGSHLGECPICCLPLPLQNSKYAMMSCCSKLVCNGCNYANSRREYEAGLERRCAFCREPAPKSQEAADKRLIKRVKKNDPIAMCRMGQVRKEEGDYETALNYLTKAAELGDMVAHNALSHIYCDGDGVEKDKGKGMHHLEEAAIGGNPEARHNLGIVEWNNGRYERARKHFIIAANLGYHDSLGKVKLLYAKGHASKEDYADALRAYQAAVQATKSAERDEADAVWKLHEAFQGS
jgi:tetratricopeptide (TPR) repeat protein